jgi:recombinational DNA repair protein (RecF pathway)
MEGIIYKTTPFESSSLLLHVITSKGLITLVAKGALKLKSEYRYYCSFLNKISFEEKNRSMYQLSNPQLLNDYKDIKSDIDKLSYLVMLFNVVSRFKSDYDKIYQLINFTLDSNDFYNAFFYTNTHLFSLEGYALNLIPKDPNIVGFNISIASFVYEGDVLKCDLDIHLTLLLVNIYYYKDLTNLSGSDILSLMAFINKYYEYHLDIKLTLTSDYFS